MYMGDNNPTNHIPTVKYVGLSRIMTIQTSKTTIKLRLSAVHLFLTLHLHIFIPKWLLQRRKHLLSDFFLTISLSLKAE